MGLSTVDPHSRKSTPRFTKSPSLVLIGLILTEIKAFDYVKIYKEMFGHRSCFRSAIHLLVNSDIFKWLYLA